MLEYHFDFENRLYLVLLALVPALWLLSYRSLAGLGRVRRIVAITVRSLVLVLLVAALAEMQKVRSSDRLTVLYLLDHSLSISPADLETALDYVNAAIVKQRGQHPDDQAGVIVFGREAAIELPPLDEAQQAPVIESIVDREYTNLTAGMKLAQASFPPDTAKRVVLLTDGNQNLGNALAQARRVVGDGIGIDVVPIRTRARGEVAVEKVAIPSDVRRGEPFDLHAVINNTAKTGRAKGRLQITRRAGDQQQILADDPVELEPGKSVFTHPEEINAPEFYSWDVRFIPDDPADDAMPQNNRASAFTHVHGTGQVLLIEDYENKGEFDRLAAGLRAMNIEVLVRPSGPEPAFEDLAQLQPFDSVLLANVPREHFSDEQIQMLVRNTQNMGAGLLMLGGPNSFGAGGWSNTLIEEAMPVDFQIKSSKVIPVGALALMMHASEMPEGNHWQKVIAQEAIRALGHQDYCGLLHWNATDQWLWMRPRGMDRVGPNRKFMLAQLDRMVPGDMPQFAGAMQMALNAFNSRRDAAVKHMIVISDGDPSPPGNSLLRKFASAKITITTVGVGTHGKPEISVLQDIAVKTGGKFYNVTNPKMLPKIYQKEARQVSRPLVFEQATGFAPQVMFPHEMIQGINQLPPITGYVMTTVKENPLVEVSLLSPLPSGQNNNTILASWTYGLGKAVVLTTDAGSRWATSWAGWENYDKLFSQIVRWSMRPVQDTGKFTVTTDFDDGKIKVVVTALDKNDEFLNFLDLGATVVGPNMKPLDLSMRQVAPGRYVGELEAKEKGNYFMMVSPGPGRAPIRTGINVPYSDEFRDRQTNEGLLTTLAGLTPRQGKPGQLIDYPLDISDRKSRVSQMLAVNTFRHDLPKANQSQDIWHLLVLAAGCIFFADVFVRRVNVNLTWVVPLAARVRARLLRREMYVEPAAMIERLRSRKAEVTGQLEQKRAALRFEPEPDAKADVGTLTDEVVAPVARQPAPPQAGAMGPEKEAESYTSRLLKAKQRVWEERQKDQS